MRQMKTVVCTILFTSCLAAKAIAAMPAPLTLDQLVEICGSSTIAEAAARGDTSGWGRMSDQIVANWKAGFLAYNGGPVQVVGWRRSDDEKDGLLSFWIAGGPNAQKACTYMIFGQAGFLEGLEKRFGSPDGRDQYDDRITAFWKKGPQEIAFSGTSANVLVTISSKD